MFTKKIIFVLTLFLFSFQVITFAGDVVPAGKNSASEPDVNITAKPAFGPAPLTVSFDASSFLYHYGEKLSFSWDFNDGGRSTGASTVHTFNSTGTYAVALTVDTPFGLKSSWVVIIVN